MADKFSGMAPDIIRNIALSLSLENIAAFCRTSHHFNAAVCDNDSFWRHKLQQDYPLLTDNLRYTRGEILLPVRFSSFKELYRFASGGDMPEIVSGFTTFQLIAILDFLRDVTFYVYDPALPNDPPLPHTLSKEEFDEILIEANAGWIADIINGVPPLIFPFNDRFSQDFRIPGVISLSASNEYIASSKRALEVEAHRPLLYDQLQTIIYRYFFPVQYPNQSLNNDVLPRFEVADNMSAPMERYYLRVIFSTFTKYRFIIDKLNVDLDNPTAKVDNSKDDIYNNRHQQYVLDAIYAGFNLSSRDREPNRLDEVYRVKNRMDIKAEFEGHKHLLQSRNLIPPNANETTIRRLIEEMINKRKKAKELLSSEQYRNFSPENKKKLQQGLIARGLHPNDLNRLLSEL